MCFLLSSEFWSSINWEAIGVVIGAIFTGGVLIQMILDARARDGFEKTSRRARIAVTLEDHLIEEGKEVPWFGDTTWQEEKRIKWLIEVPVYNDSGNTRKGLQLKVTPTIKNMGQTPALKIVVHGKLSVRGFPEVIGYDGYGNTIGFSETIELMPGEKSSEKSFPKEPKDFELSNSEFEVLRDYNTNGKSICFCGRVLFEDIFGDKWTRLFAWDIIWREVNGAAVFRKTNDWNKEIKGWEYPSELPKPT